MYQDKPLSPDAPHTLQIQPLSLDHPWRWVQAGWLDFRRCPLLSLCYGAAFVVAGHVLVAALLYRHLGPLVPALFGGFLLIAPALCIGLMDVSRRLQAGEPISLRASLDVGRGGCMLLGLVLVGIFALWLLAALVGYEALAHGADPSRPLSVWWALASAAGSAYMVTFTVLGALAASLVFRIAAIGVPLLLDRDMDPLNAMVTSWRAVQFNRGPMALWALLIVLFTIAGIMTFLLGLAIALPVLSYATWHAFGDVIQPQRRGTVVIALPPTALIA